VVARFDVGDGFPLDTVGPTGEDWCVDRRLQFLPVAGFDAPAWLLRHPPDVCGFPGVERSRLPVERVHLVGPLDARLRTDGIGEIVLDDLADLAEAIARVEEGIPRDTEPRAG